MLLRNYSLIRLQQPLFFILIITQEKEQTFSRHSFLEKMKYTICVIQNYLSEISTISEITSALTVRYL